MQSRWRKWPDAGGQKQDYSKGDVGPVGSALPWKKHVIYLFIYLLFFWRAFTFQLLVKSRGHGCRPFLPPSDSCLQFLSRIGFSNPTARRFFVECCYLGPACVSLTLGQRVSSGLLQGRCPGQESR